MGCLYCYRATMYLVSACFVIDRLIMHNYYRWFNANHVYGTIMPWQSSMDAPSSNKGYAASSGKHKTVRKKDVKAASDRKKVRVGYEEMARYWSEKMMMIWLD